MPKIFITLFAMVILSACITPAFAGPFSDVQTDHWAYDAVNELQMNGLVVGYPDGTFKGDDMFTRYEMAMVIARMYDQFNEIVCAIDYGYDTPDLLTLMKLDEIADTFNDLLVEFSTELEMIGCDSDDMKDWMWNVEDRVTALEKETPKVQVGGSLRFKIEDIITNEYLGPYGTPYLSGTTGTGMNESFIVKERIILAFKAQPAPFISTYVDLWQDRSFISGSTGG